MVLVLKLKNSVEMNRIKMFMLLRFKKVLNKIELSFNMFFNIQNRYVNNMLE